MALFEGYEIRIDQINAVLNSYGISSIEEAEKITKDAGLDVYDQVKKIQPICFENACWAYTVGCLLYTSVLRRRQISLFIILMRPLHLIRSFISRILKAVLRM